MEKSWQTRSSSTWPRKLAAWIWWNRSRFIINPFSLTMHSNWLLSTVLIWYLFLPARSLIPFHLLIVCFLCLLTESKKESFSMSKSGGEVSEKGFQSLLRNCPLRNFSIFRPIGVSSMQPILACAAQYALLLEDLILAQGNEIVRLSIFHRKKYFSIHKKKIEKKIEN